MTGIIDVGGGMRCTYSAGIYDFLIDRGIRFDYCLGVSAGSGNLITYIAGQRGRTLMFYAEYSRRREYMSVSNYLRKGSYIDLDYIYSTLSDETGEYPVDYDAVFRSHAELTVVATRGDNGEAEYFGKKHIQKNNIDVIKASCCLPLICKPYFLGDIPYFDGGVADPVPIEKALADGCDKIVAVLTRPIGNEKNRERMLPVFKAALRRYPTVYEGICVRHIKYNQSVAMLRRLEKEGRAVILSPTDLCGVDTLTRAPEPIGRLYAAGYEDAQRRIGDIEKFFIKKN